MNNKSIISLFIHCYPPAKGGAEYLAKNFVDVLKDKYDIHIFTGKGETLDSYKTFSNYLPPETNSNIHRLELNQPIQRFFNKFFNKIIFIIGHFSPFYFGPILKYTPADLEIISKSQTIIGIAMPTKSFYDAYFYAHKFGKKLILVPAYHNVSYYNRCSFFQQAFNYASKIFFLTPFEKDELSSNYQIDKSKFIQTTFCPFTEEQIKNQKIRPKNISKTMTIGFIGQITLRKNLGVFKEYLDRYLIYWQKQGITLKVYLAGAKTNSSNQVQQMFQKYINKKIVKINYDFSDNTKPDKFSKIDIFINPSVEESLGIVNFESIFYGCKLIIKSHSAFDSLSSSLITYTDLSSLHNQIIKIKDIPAESNKDLFQKYSFNHFAKIVLT